jgi:sigma-70 family protein
LENKGEIQMENNERYIYVNGNRIYVSDEVYKEYKKKLNHEEYLKRKDIKQGVFNFSDYGKDILNIIDTNIDPEKIIETKMRIEDLYRALDSLNDEERAVIEALYFDKMSIRDLAKEKEVSIKNVFNFRNKVLNKLKEILERLK